MEVIDLSFEMYKFEEPEQSNLKANLVYVTKSKYDETWHSTLHSHPFTEIFFVLSGKGYFKVANETFQVKTNDLLIINPNIEHTEQSNKVDTLEYIALGVDGLSFSSKESEDQYTFLQYDRNSYITFLDSMISELKYSFPEHQRICQHIFLIILTKIKRDNELQVSNVDTRIINNDIAIIKNYMHHHYRENITLDLLSQVVCLNKYYLAHIFKKVVGISPIEYLNQIRINESKVLLETTNYSIVEIANITGFSSQSFFAQTFKRITGTTPSAWRKKKN